MKVNKFFLLLFCLVALDGYSQLFEGRLLYSDTLDYKDSEAENSKYIKLLFSEHSIIQEELLTYNVSNTVLEIIGYSSGYRTIHSGTSTYSNSVCDTSLYTLLEPTTMSSSEFIVTDSVVQYNGLNCREITIQLSNKLGIRKFTYIPDSLEIDPQMLARINEPYLATYFMNSKFFPVKMQSSFDGITRELILLEAHSDTIIEKKSPSSFELESQLKKEQCKAMTSKDLIGSWCVNDEIAPTQAFPRSLFDLNKIEYDLNFILYDKKEADVWIDGVSLKCKWKFNKGKLTIESSANQFKFESHILLKKGCKLKMTRPVIQYPSQ